MTILNRDYIPLALFLALAFAMLSTIGFATSYGYFEVDGCQIVYQADCVANPYKYEVISGGTEETALAISRIFSATICQVESIIGEVFGEVWCIISDEIQAPLAAAITLYIIIFAISFTIGLTPLSAGEAISRLIKILLIWSFATEADFALGLMFSFYMYVLKDGIDIVLSATGSGTQVDLINNLDDLAGQIFAYNDFNEDGRIVTGLAAVAALIFMPGSWFVAPAIITVTLMSFLVFARTIITYLVALIAVVFYLSMGPVFISLALFKSTNDMFRKWFSQLNSFALQPVIIFAYLFFVEYIYRESSEDLSFSFVELVQQVGVLDGGGENATSATSGTMFDMPVFMMNEFCTDPNTRAVLCPHLDPDWEPDEGTGDFTQVFGGLALFAILNYATMQFLQIVPEIARLLTSGGGRAIKLGGGLIHQSFRSGGDALRAPVLDNVQPAIDRAAQMNSQGATDEQISASFMRSLVPDTSPWR